VRLSIYVNLFGMPNGLSGHDIGYQAMLFLTDWRKLRCYATPTAAIPFAALHVLFCFFINVLINTP